MCSRIISSSKALSAADPLRADGCAVRADESFYVQVAHEAGSFANIVSTGQHVCVCKHVQDNVCVLVYVSMYILLSPNTELKGLCVKGARE